MKQTSTPPSSDDFISIDEGILNIIKFDDGEFKMMNDEGTWESIENLKTDWRA